MSSIQQEDTTHQSSDLSTDQLLPPLSNVTIEQLQEILLQATSTQAKGPLSSLLAATAASTPFTSPQGTPGLEHFFAAENCTDQGLNHSAVSGGGHIYT